MGDGWKFFWNSVVILVGWYVVHLLSRTRDRDKARRDLVVKFTDDAAKDVDELLNTAVGYHIGSRDRAIERRIVMRTTDLQQRLGDLSSLWRDRTRLSNCRSAMSRLKISITGSHFEDEHDGPLAEGSEQLEAMAADASQLKRALTSLKHSLYSQIGN